MGVAHSQISSLFATGTEFWGNTQVTSVVQEYLVEVIFHSMSLAFATVGNLEELGALSTPTPINQTMTLTVTDEGLRPTTLNLKNPKL